MTILSILISRTINDSSNDTYEKTVWYKNITSFFLMAYFDTTFNIKLKNYSISKFISAYNEDFLQ